MRPEFSPRERELIKFLLDGLSNYEIAARMGSTTQSIKTRLRLIYRRIGIDEKLFRPRVRLAYIAHFMKDRFGIVCSACVKDESVPAGTLGEC
jgi:DNA-binding NarL/FixJ family response regulator